MEKERKDYNISIEKELEAIQNLSDKLIEDGFNAENTVIITVSTDYSAIAGQLIRHNLSINGEIAEGFGIDVPYPDQHWDEDFIYELKQIFKVNSYKFKNKKILLIENAIIRGGNYSFLTIWIKKRYPNIEVKTLSLYENVHSTFKSDYVFEYYDNDIQDITFHFEKPNRHWS